MSDDLLNAADDQKPREPSPSRTRDHLANERTLLAWVRTSIAIMGLGFIVARFGLLLRELGATNSHPLPTGVSTVFGVALSLCGVVVLILSLQRYRAVGEGVEHNEYGWSPGVATTLTLVLAAAGTLLAIYLIITA
jgi:inner membrane protein YidH